MKLDRIVHVHYPSKFRYYICHKKWTDVSSSTKIFSHMTAEPCFQETVAGFEMPLGYSKCSKGRPFTFIHHPRNIHSSDTIWQNLLLYLNVMSTKYKHGSYLLWRSSDAKWLHNWISKNKMAWKWKYLQPVKSANGPLKYYQNDCNLMCYRQKTNMDLSITLETQCTYMYIDRLTAVLSWPVCPTSIIREKKSQSPPVNICQEAVDGAI